MAAGVTRFDAEHAAARYRLYSSNNPALWEAFYNSLEPAAAKAEKLMDAALKPTSTDAAIRKAAEAVHAIMSDLRFCECRPGSPGRDFALAVWAEKEEEADQLLFARAVENVASRAGISPEDVVTRLAKEAA